MVKVTATIITYDAVSAKPNKKPLVSEYETATIDNALYLAMNMSYYFPGCVSASIEDKGKVVQLFNAPEWKNEALDAAGVVIRRRMQR